MGSVRLAGIIQFGEEFELDPENYELRRSGRGVKLEPIPMELLLLLVEQPGRLVTREQIVERLWSPGVALDTDNSINGAIRKLRQVLADDPEHPRFIQTVTGRGYRFIAPVRTPTQPASATPPRAVADASPGMAITGRRGWQIALGIVVVLVAAGVYLQWPRSQVPPAAAGGRLMLAVLPFENLTGDPGQEYFSDGLTEELISRLGNLDPQRLGVIARTSVMGYKQNPKPLNRVGKELKVDYVLEGSVRREGNRVRVAAQLIETVDQTHLWAQQYDRDLSSLLAVQAEIAQAVAEEIQLTLAGGKEDVAGRRPLSPAAVEAHDLYLRGRYAWNQRTASGFQQAIRYFEEALAKDPTYARAYAGLADSYALLTTYYLAAPHVAMPKAREAARKALELDSRLAEAHTSLALIAEFYDWDWPAAEKEFRRAIQLNPNYATAHHWYAESLAFQGRFREALAEIERARQLDPLSAIIAADKGAILYFSRQYDRAIAQFRAVREMEPGSQRARMIVFALVETGRFEEALADLETWEETETEPWAQAWRAYVHGRSGQAVRAQPALERLDQLSRQEKVNPGAMILAYAGNGEKDRALGWLRKAYEERSPLLASLKVDPIYDPLRDDPRFQEVLRGVGFAP